MHDNDIRFAARVQDAADQHNPKQVEAAAAEILADAGGSALAQSRQACAQARQDGDAETYALWLAIQIKLLEWGPPSPVHA